MRVDDAFVAAVVASVKHGRWDLSYEDIIEATLAVAAERGMVVPEGAPKMWAVKTITELREAFRNWPDCDPTSFELLAALNDPTPITEAGLRELGFEQYFGSCVWWAGELRFTYEDDTLHFERREIKTLGKLRLLLLGVGE